MVVIVAVLAIAGIQPFFEANPEWRLLSIVGSLSAVAMTLALVYQIGGIPWLAHFAFPVLFFLVAVPWPRPWENHLMERLMSQNATLIVEALHWGGYEAERQGNLILLPTGLLGIEEACSGIRSLQSNVMASLFFGEFFRVKAVGRIGLFVAAVAASLAGNIIRSGTLAVVASRSGTDAVHAWHDPTGLFILFAGIAVIAALGWAMRNKQPQAENADSHHDFSRIFSSIRTWRPAAWLVLAFWLASLASTEAWYRSCEEQRVTTKPWFIQRRASHEETETVPIPDRTLNILQYPDGFSERWVDDAGMRWQIFYFRWPPRQAAVQAARIHDPRICLAAVGMTLEEVLAPTIVEKDGLTLRLNTFRFRSQGAPLYVFHAVIEDSQDGSSKEGFPSSVTKSSRVDAVLSGRRNQGQRLIELASWGATSREEAEQSLRAFLNDHLIVGNQASH